MCVFCRVDPAGQFAVRDYYEIAGFIEKGYGAVEKRQILWRDVGIHYIVDDNDRAVQHIMVYDLRFAGLVLVFDYSQELFDVAVIDSFFLPQGDLAYMCCQCGFASIAFADDNKVLPFVDPLHVFELLHLPRDTGLEPRRIEILFRQSACIAHIVELFKIFSQFVAKLSNNPFRARDLNIIGAISASSSHIAHYCDVI